MKSVLSLLALVLLAVAADAQTVTTTTTTTATTTSGPPVAVAAPVEKVVGYETRMVPVTRTRMVAVKETVLEARTVAVERPVVVATPVVETPVAVRLARPEPVRITRAAPLATAWANRARLVVVPVVP